MGNFWKSFWGAFFGKLVAVMFVIAAGVIGLGPETWVAWFLTDLPQYITPNLARITLIVLGALTLSALLGPILRDFRGIRFGTKSLPSSDLQLIFLPGSPWIDILKNHEGRKLGRIHRMKVKNVSDNNSLHNVTLSIAEIENWTHSYPNTPLSVLGGSVRFDLNPGAEQFVNLFKSDDKKNEDHLSILYDDQSIPNQLPRRDKKIRIQARSDDTPSIDMWVTTRTTAGGKTIITPVGD